MPDLTERVARILDEEPFLTLAGLDAGRDRDAHPNYRRDARERAEERAREAREKACAAIREVLAALRDGLSEPDGLAMRGAIDAVARHGPEDDCETDAVNVVHDFLAGFEQGNGLAD